MFVLRRFSNIPKTLINIPKRNFWKVEEQAMSVHVRGIGKRGFVFSHHDAMCSVNKFGVDSEDVTNSFHLSLEKYCVNDYTYFRKCMESDEKIVIKMERHLVGVTWLGNICFPYYLKGIVKDINAYKGM